MNENFKWIAAAVVFVALAVGAILYRSKLFRAEDPVAPVAAAPVKTPPPAEPEIQHPLPAAPTPEPLPALDQSDGPALNALTELIGKEHVERFIVPRDLVRHIVVTVDNLPTEQVAERIRPLKPTPGTFAVAGTEEAPTLDLANYERYKPLVQLADSLDTDRLVKVYTRNYPLFQEAYASLGHPPKYFNDRLIEVIDHLLATPDVPGPIALTQPSVMYKYADPKIEALSAGQKALIRMGRDNASVVKNKLRELRDKLIAQKQGT